MDSSSPPLLRGCLWPRLVFMSILVIQSASKRPCYVHSLVAQSASKPPLPQSTPPPHIMFKHKETRTVLTGNRCFNNGNFNAQPVFAQWLKSQKTKEGKSKYSIAQINNYPTGTSAVQVVTTLAYAWLSDGFLNGRRWPPMLVSGVCICVHL